MKHELFGNNISPACELCDNFSDSGESVGCSLGRQIKNGKCRKFSYNPTLRTPKAEARMMQFSKEDFEL